ncbi:NADH-quinone oxidoreductase subunit NuoG [Colwellia hornerae]|uniref:NADH-quinone oxidoreductase subunit G n=1 Tax=Colwellia hornerae TaxID=89402 RepID=A0A5C6QPM9_9GAMM|nr:NADH-quinone oxidoreductase subunit NuoG [Colwellia hornerae]TWX56279.1 NADH-quinone oxidoreductase subunit NuoG [Colwellia hornerae]TWX62130.1 NADH-quinone oxidoreductase subunit NuoG [Colwellia hornerae]TWX70532.1 NADH-quinone oxidoreductase subunit NuoG [Colwellia hornerae]
MDDKNISAAQKVTVYIDNIAYQVSKENNLLAGVLSQKLNLPYFCWHPSMGSVGACRQCAVTQYQDENDTRGRLVMACMTSVSDGMRISLQDKDSAKFREQVIGAMMTNHPHDCPVCAEGGECHLQDMTVMTGHSVRDYQGTKRTFNNQYLGELVGHEMNRCITCYRCTRFYNDYAGGKDFGVYGSKNQVYFGRQKDGTLASEFSGNLVEVCPTGVFTNKVFSAHYTRKWDLQSAPSVCAHCSVGCNTSIGERYGSVRRVMNRYNYDLNGYFLCDRGRYGIGFVNSAQRIKKAQGINQTSPEKLTRLDVSRALAHFRDKRFIGIGSARASLEANFYLKQIVGEDNFSAGYNRQQMAVAKEYQQLLSDNFIDDKMLSLREIEQCDFILLVGEDLTKTSPRIALALRQACRNSGIEKAASMGVASWQDSAVRTISGKRNSPFFAMQPMATKLDELTEQCLLLAPDDIEQVMLALTTVLCLTDNEKSNYFHQEEWQAFTFEQQSFINKVISALATAKKPLIVTGDSLLSAKILLATNKLMACLKNQATPSKVNLVVLPSASNSIGLLSLIDEKSISSEQVLAKVSTKTVAGLICLEQELTVYTNEQLTLLREHAEVIIVLDHSESRVSQLADIVLPAAAISEGNGHFVNYQGRIQRFSQVHAAALPILDSWKWLSYIEKALDFSISNQATLQRKKAKPKENLAELHDYFSENFTLWPTLKDEQLEQKFVARMTKRASGRTSQSANFSVHEAKVVEDKDQHYRFSMEGNKPNAVKNMPFTWAPGWNSNQSINHHQVEIQGQLSHYSDDVYVSFNFTRESDKNVAVNDDTLAAVITDLTAKKTLTYFPQGCLFQGEWQSALTAEFQLLAHSLEKNPTLYLSTEFVESQGWEPGQWLNVSADNKSCFAQLKCNNELPQYLVYGNINDFVDHKSGLSIKLTEVSEADVIQYQKNRQTHYQHLKVIQQNTLKQLKISDQHIPIRFVAGGLDDA